LSRGYVRFSNRPVRVKRFQTVHCSGVDVTRGVMLLYGIGTQAFPSWDPRTRWNHLLGGLATGRSKRTCELTSSFVPRGTPFHRVVELGFPPTSFDRSRCCSVPGPAERGTVNPDNGMDRPRSYRVNGNAAEGQLIRERSAP
jgi:hypothetical protein